MSRPGAVVGAARFRGTRGPLRVTWPFAVAWADDQAVHVRIRPWPVAGFSRLIQLTTGASAFDRGVTWASPWSSLRQVRVAHRSATFLEENGDRCIVISPTARRFRALRDAIEEHAPYVTVGTTMFDSFIRLPSPADAPSRRDRHE